MKNHEGGSTKQGLSEVYLSNTMVMEVILHEITSGIYLGFDKPSIAHGFPPRVYEDVKG